MTRCWSVVSLVILFTWSPLLAAQDFKPPESKPPSAEMAKEIQAKKNRLEAMLKVLAKQGVRDPGLGDAEIYFQAVQRLLEHHEFFHDQSPAWASAVLDRGMLRARFLSAGEMPWMITVGHSVVRAFRSRIDGSLQPYAVTLPVGYGKDLSRKWRIDVVLHGRDTTITEVKFLHQHNGDQAAPKEQDWVQIDIFGRGNNAYRWAGETDVLEAVDSFFTNERLANRGHLLDPSRVVLRGFSMGGAGTWHLGLHFPDRWCLIAPGAGFTTTHGYIPKMANPLPYPQEQCLRIYDAVDYAENAFNVPVIAYSGAKDPQMQAAVNMENRLKELGIPMTHLIAPDRKHEFPKEWRIKAEDLYAKQVAKGRAEYPKKIRFVTYSLKYPSYSWVELLGLFQHYEKARVEADRTDNGWHVKTENVRVLRLTPPDGITQEQELIIDGQKLAARPWLSQFGGIHVFLERKNGRWTSVLPQRIFTDRVRRAQKITGLTGPIDDAFTDGFLCVRGTSRPWHEATGKQAESNLERFALEWAKYFRGVLPVKDDLDVTNEDIASKNLILFGDPASNSLLASVVDGLPLEWTREAITLAGKKYSAADHVPVMIYPNPLNANRYVVLNSGHTFHAADFQGTNALLYPRLGDYAILRLNEEVATSGLFDDFWRLPEKK